MKRVYKCEYCYLQNARPCYECSACMSGDDHFRPVKPEKKQMTNADKIRAMSDEELSKFIREPFCDKRTHEECTISYCGVCDQCVLDWLQQPAEEGE